MAFSPVTGQPVQYSTEDNELASGYYLKLYNANTTVPYSMAVDATGVDRLAKAKLNDEGYPISNPLDNETVFVPHTDQDYRMVLYRNETDADNNTTANAAWNVDSLRPDASDTQEAANITLRDTTLLAQDDYDRSPLFTDGNGFTAGLGPHVITVPVQVPAWTPNDGIMRFYRLESDGTITSLTPTSTDATTFTLAETLLSTDTIYIGDDNFRNQMDGDPADIRVRLGVDAADELRLEKANNLSDVASASTSRDNLDVYSKSESNSNYIEDDVNTVTNTNLAGNSVTNDKILDQTILARKLDYTVHAFSGVVPAGGYYTFTYNEDVAFTPLFTTYDATFLNWHVYVVSGVSVSLRVYNSDASPHNVVGSIITVDF